MKASLHEHSENGEDRLKWRYQDKAYNESYKQWRKRNRDEVGFYFAENPNQLTYQDGVGFIKDAPEAHEAKTLRRTVSVLGAVLLFRVFFDAFSEFVLPALLGAMGLDISYDIFTGRLYGGEMLLIALKFITEALSVTLPALLLVVGFKLPFKVMLPMRTANKHMFRACVPAAVLIGGVCCCMSEVFCRLFRLRSMPDSSLFPKTTAGWVFMTVTHIVLIPVISELCSGGIILQLTRQFGDGLAIVLTSLITAAFCYDISQFFLYFVLSVSIRYFTLRTGSVLSGALMRLTASLYSFGLLMIRYRTAETRGRTFAVLYLFVTLIPALAYMIRFLYRRSDCFGINMHPRYMPFSKKMMWVVTSIPILLWLTAAFILTVINSV